MTQPTLFDDLYREPRVPPPAPEPARFPGQRGEILARLQRGPATNVELSKIGLRFGARLKELRDAGYQIVIVSDVGGVVTYALNAGQ